MLSKIWVGDPGIEIRDPGFGKNYFESGISDPGVKKALDPGSGCDKLKRLGTAEVTCLR
jgi:hypothetical protein